MSNWVKISTNCILDLDDIICIDIPGDKMNSVVFLFKNKYTYIATYKNEEDAMWVFKKVIRAIKIDEKNHKKNQQLSAI